MRLFKKCANIQYFFYMCKRARKLFVKMCAFGLKIQKYFCMSFLFTTFVT